MRSHRRLLVPIIVVAAALLGACSSDDGGGDSATTGANTTATTAGKAPDGAAATTAPASPTTAGKGEVPADLTPISIGATRAVSNVSLVVGVEQGFFAEEGIDLQINWAQGGAAVVPGVLNGETQFGETNTSSLIVAHQNGLPITGIMGSATGAADPALDTMGVLVLKDSDIQTPEDLAGKTIAVNALGGLGQITVRAALENLGVDASGIQYVEVPFPDMAVALTEHRVDAVWQTETFLTPMLDVARIVLPTAATAHPSLQFGLFITSDSYLADHPDEVAAFRRAMTKSMDFAQANPDVVRGYFVSAFDLDPALAQKVRLVQWLPAIDQASLELWAKWLVEFDIIKGPINLDKLVDAG